MRFSRFRVPVEVPEFVSIGSRLLFLSSHVNCQKGSIQSTCRTQRYRTEQHTILASTEAAVETKSPLLQ
jgi:hypothetical protein